MKVRWSDDTVTDELVSWDDFDSQLLSKPGAFDVKGVVTVSSKSLSVTADSATNTCAADESLVTYDVVAHITVVEQQTETDPGSGTGDGNQQGGSDGSQGSNNGHGDGSGDGQDLNQNGDTTNDANDKVLVVKKRHKQLANTGAEVGLVLAFAVLAAASGVMLRRRSTRA
ncbi:hypothetical protein [Bifidobacterium tsurumiense]|uniref:Uncharacterized protein n=1 Tax=Bifidobacterium tsurumiense TaxID=356829 RepID=A0A087EEE3_9BIFI|nr:hypothetical protein [Bifidobacterium tsurumiense]KFJ06144.1 hypothetical protein BITS_1013 [Bifidobacterium tsurumiense]